MRLIITPIFLTALIGFVAGCQDRAVVDNEKPAKLPGLEEPHDHEHPDEGPHGGQLIELGQEEYHAELVHDHDAHRITFYVLDGSAKETVPVAQTELTVNVVAEGKPQQFKVPAAPLDSDPAGQSSRFETTDEALDEALFHAPGAEARLSVTVGDKPFVGEFTPAEEHGDHDHEHEGEEHKGEDHDHEHEEK